MRGALLVACLLGFLGQRAVANEEDEEEGRSVLLLYKKMEPMEGFVVGEPINITLSVFNKGLGNAYSLMVADDNWKQDKFRIISGANNFSLDYLNAGDQYVFTFTVAPIKKTWHRVRPAKMVFIDGVEGEVRAARTRRPAQAQRCAHTAHCTRPRLTRAHVAVVSRRRARSCTTRTRCPTSASPRRAPRPSRGLC